MVVSGKESSLVKSIATDRPPVKPADIPLRIYSNPICPFAQVLSKPYNTHVYS
jgi:hypothetical protein